MSKWRRESGTEREAGKVRREEGRSYFWTVTSAMRERKLSNGMKGDFKLRCGCYFAKKQPEMFSVKCDDIKQITQQ